MSVLARIVSKTLPGRGKCVIFPILNTATKTTGSAQHQIDEYVDRNKARNRPMSPHLTIYKPQLTSMLSITHRATGIVMAAATSTFAVATLLSPETVEWITTYIQTMHDSTIGSLFLYDMKFMFAFLITFHSINGLRHLMWDRAQGLNISQVYQSGWALLLLSVALAGLFPFMF